MIKKVKYIGSNVWGFVTLHKTYDVINETFAEIEIADDDGDECWFSKDNFEPVEETKKTLLEYFMELHDLKEGDEFKMNFHQSKIQGGVLLVKSQNGDYWIQAEFPLHFYDKVEITKIIKN